ncbi:MAG: phospholipase, partial [Candidatus Marinimicrobia bacterium]|nr:phospholipase [Candidatus Neomarinimicrobiota bacterium]
VIPNISVKLSTIPEWTGGYIPFSRVEHCKFMVVDDSITWVGSSNWKRDYFYSSRNIGIIVKNKKINETMKNIFLKSWDGPYSWQVKPEVKYTPKYYGEGNR